MNKSESKYYNTALKIDQAFIEILNKKDFEYITVKEICNLAGVNRSTFYLHYETINDLLIESNEYLIDKFVNSCENENLTRKDIQKMSNEELNFITPKYLLPWLTFIKDNKVLFKTYINKFSKITMQKNNRLLYDNIVNPILERYKIDEIDKPYLLKFYSEGILAIVKYWLSINCSEPIEKISKIIINCVNYGKF